jgi:predicted  nucleic acid-binding Zn-ribbon protein
MSIADDVEALEYELGELRQVRRDLEKELADANDTIADQEYDIVEMEAFIAYVDKTQPELRTAFEATKKLEG